MDTLHAYIMYVCIKQSVHTTLTLWFTSYLATYDNVAASWLK